MGGGYNNEPYSVKMPPVDHMGGAEYDSSGLGSLPRQNLGIQGDSLDMKMMVRGSLLSSGDEADTKKAAHLDFKSSDDLTLDMLGGPTTASAMTLRPQQSQPNVGMQQNEAHQQPMPSSFAQITTKNPPSSALNLHANVDSRGTLIP